MPEESFPAKTSPAELEASRYLPVKVDVGSPFVTGQKVTLSSVERKMADFALIRLP
jgi:hypothetical protein